MEESTRARIKKCMPTLCRYLSVECLLMAYLYQGNVVDQKQYQQIKCCSTDHDRARYLLNDVILRGPERKYKALLRILKEVGQEHLVDILQGNINTDSLPSRPDLSNDLTMLTMEEKESINQHWADLVTCISPDACFFAILRQKCILNDIQQQNITCKGTPEERVRGILDVVLTGPKWKYTGFLHALRTSDMGHAADIIENPNYKMPSMGSGGVEGDWALLTGTETESVLDALPLLIRSLDFNSVFFACLLQKNIINKEKKDMLKPKARHSQVLHLMCILLRGPRRHLEAFNEVLEDCDMDHLKLAESQCTKPTNALWDWSSPNNQQMLSSEKVDQMKKCLTKLTSSLNVSDSFWAHLLHQRVVDITTMEEIEGNSNKPDWMKATDLICYLWRQPVWKYHGFLKAARDCGMEHIVSLIEEDVTLP